MPDSSCPRPGALATAATNAPAWRQADHAVDAVGLQCPEPLMLVRNKVRGMAAGETVAVVATDPSTGRDFTNFCRFMGHEMTWSERSGDHFRFVIRKG